MEGSDLFQLTVLCPLIHYVLWEQVDEELQVGCERRERRGEGSRGEGERERGEGRGEGRGGGERRRGERRREEGREKEGGGEGRVRGQRWKRGGRGEGEGRERKGAKRMKKGIEGACAINKSSICHAKGCLNNISKP